ncbi:MAG TPA: hypothetical protein VGF67_33205 [Ktedonobacteraceae bacterium]|jgi:hypothetical protein
MVATLAAHHHLPGSPVVALKNAHNKALVRQVLAQAGVRQPRFAVLQEIAGIAGPQACR